MCYLKLREEYLESVIALPPHGLQLETHYSFLSVPIFVSRRFVPLVMLQDVVINEGLSGWNVRYYLMTIKRERNDSLSIDVAFQVSAHVQSRACLRPSFAQRILPKLPILKEVYQGVQQILFVHSHYLS